MSTDWSQASDAELEAQQLECLRFLAIPRSHFPEIGDADYQLWRLSKERQLRELEEEIARRKSRPMGRQR